MFRQFQHHLQFALSKQFNLQQTLKLPKKTQSCCYSTASKTNAEKTPPPNDEEQKEHQHQQQQQQEAPKKQQTKSRRTNVPAVRNPFESIADKNKESYLTMVEIFNERDVHRRNHVEFIYAALKHMVEFGVEHDLDVYKALIDVMPKGKFIPTNLFQAEFMHYPKQQQCIIDLLEQMEDLGVMPDYEMEAMLLNVFGRKGYPLRKYWRMMYWMPKFRNSSPWPLPEVIPDHAFEIAKLAVERMCSVDLRSEVRVYETKDLKDAIDDTWIVSGMSAEQTQLLREHPRNKALYIEGPFLIWLRNRTINYFTLRADPNLQLLEEFRQQAPSADEADDLTRLVIPFFGRPPQAANKVAKLRSIHQQDDGTIFAICATGTSTKDSLLSWVRALEADGNPSLGEIPVLFRFKSEVKTVERIASSENDGKDKPATSVNSDPADAQNS